MGIEKIDEHIEEHAALHTPMGVDIRNNGSSIEFYYDGTKIAVLESSGKLRIKGGIIAEDPTL